MSKLMARFFSSQIKGMLLQSFIINSNKENDLHNITDYGPFNFTNYHLFC